MSTVGKNLTDPKCYYSLGLDIPDEDVDSQRDDVPKVQPHEVDQVSSLAKELSQITINDKGPQISSLVRSPELRINPIDLVLNCDVAMEKPSGDQVDVVIRTEPRRGSPGCAPGWSRNISERQKRHLVRRNLIGEDLSLPCGNACCILS